MTVTCPECKKAVRLPGKYIFDGWQGRTLLCSKITQPTGTKKINHKCEGFRLNKESK